jgi:transcriptional regulator GlxA family with amidase domain
VILKLQDWLEEHYAEAVNLHSLAALSGLTTRSLMRRFKLATGDRCHVGEMCHERTSSTNPG